MTVESKISVFSDFLLGVHPKITYTLSMGTKMKIKCAAIKRSDGVIVKGQSHADCVLASPYGTCKSGESIQGFVTNTGEFVTRSEAGKIAFESGQIPKLTDFLQSEDLTGDWPWKNDKKVDKS